LDGILLIQLAANGLSVGMGYALAAVGLALVFGILEQINFAHGELYMVGAFLAFTCVGLIGMPYWAALALTTVLMAAVGFALAEVAFIPTLNRPLESVILATFALSVVLQNAARLIFGASPHTIDTPLQAVTIQIGGILLFGQRLLIIGVAETGRAMRAVAQNKEAAVMVGIDIGRITRITAALGAVLTGLAAAVIAPLFDLYPNMGTDVVFKSFAVVIIGGMGNIAGSIIAGLMLGLAESYAGGLINTTVRDGIGFTLMILMLLARPQGLFGKTVRV
jgi:branched-chain amino acid transport system permease protein